MTIGWLVAWVALAELLMGFIGQRLSFDLPVFSNMVQIFREPILFAFALVGGATLPLRRQPIVEAATGLTIYLICMQEFRGPVRLNGVFDDLDLPLTFVWWISGGVIVGATVNHMVRKHGNASLKRWLPEVGSSRAMIFLAIVSGLMVIYQSLPRDSEFPYSEFPYTRWWITSLFLSVSLVSWVVTQKDGHEAIRI